jgi:hypothetical protein
VPPGVVLADPLVLVLEAVAPAVVVALEEPVEVAEDCVSVTTFVDPPQADRASPAISAHTAMANLMPVLSR